MKTEQLSVDFVGYIEKDIEPRYKRANCFSPLFEAISNSIHAIEDSENGDAGQITIEILHPQSNGMFEQTPDNSVVGFTITDNGVGFTDDNLQSFCVVHSSHKKQRGGKGVGRFSWLAFFKEVRIESVYRGKDGLFRLRRISFCKQNDGYIQIEEENAADEQARTTVRLLTTREHVKGKMRKSAPEIAEIIFKHFYLTFSKKKNLSVEIVDSLESKPLFVSNLLSNIESECFTQDIYGSELQIETAYFPCQTEASGVNRLEYCADGRSVQTLDFSKICHAPKNAFFMHKDQACNVSIYVHSTIFDQIVDSSRSELLFPNESETLLNGTTIPTEEDVDNAVSVAVRKRFKENFLRFEREKRQAVEAFLAKNPQYKAIMKFAKKELDELSFAPTPAEIEKAFHQASLRIDEEQAQKLSSLLTLMPDDLSNEDAEKTFQDVLEGIETTKQFRLTSYVLRRKQALELLSFLLKKGKSQKYPLERHIHNLLCPMQSNSNDESFLSNNLWIIDDRLLPYEYIPDEKQYYSDKTLESIPQVESESARRPDLIAFERPKLFSVGGELPLTSIIILELKRPMRDDYDPTENPIDQVLDYVDELKKGLKDVDGRPIEIDERVRVYCYILADLTPSLVKRCERHNLIKTHDGLGYYGFLSQTDPRVYVEVISYQKLLKDAEARNKAFFKMLSLPDKLFLFK